MKIEIKIKNSQEGIKKIEIIKYKRNICQSHLILVYLGESKNIQQKIFKYHNLHN